MRYFLFLMISFGVVFSTTGLHAADKTKVWGAVLVATNKNVAGDIPPALVNYQKRLSKIFGYANFKVLGESTRSFSGTGDQWLIPGGTFSVRTSLTPRTEECYRVSLQLFQGKKELVQTEAKLGPGSPLFIRGPQYGQGQIIIAIMVL